MNIFTLCFLISSSLFVLDLALAKIPPKPSSYLSSNLNPGSCTKPGEVLADGAIPTAEQIAKDAYCVAQLMTAHAPQGAITVFGSSRAGSDWPSYRITRDFALQWTKKWGTHRPILSGGGGGIMEAANRGAREAGGKSLAIGHYFGSSIEKPNPYITHSYWAASFAQREADLIDYASAVVVAPGGFGTEWEIFETLSKMQTRKKLPVPMVFLGEMNTWKTLIDRVNHLKDIKTISPEDVNMLFFAETTSEAIAYIEKSLKLGAHP